MEKSLLLQNVDLYATQNPLRQHDVPSAFLSESAFQEDCSDSLLFSFSGIDGCLALSIPSKIKHELSWNYDDLGQYDKINKTIVMSSFFLVKIDQA